MLDWVASICRIQIDSVARLYGVTSVRDSKLPKLFLRHLVRMSQVERRGLRV